MKSKRNRMRELQWKLRQGETNMYRLGMDWEHPAEEARTMTGKPQTSTTPSLCLYTNTTDANTISSTGTLTLTTTAMLRCTTRV